ncbi:MULTISPECIES: cache domain-containing protein [unclassified Oceanispirochaeta]|uniref:cache domain-containing protein n=1 Tax=unclassified Oceanispirochaeta TaxID=2635722 RepID=UPI001314008C|nr:MULTISPECIES: cache domain-containing protein [unclassified Oceanispirochaeta]MBF9014047.1 cache domain-containing protein [Oceanispirochaeta sp. M2]NPD70538.1 response regulator [Oceanispirochaeta sp. M1]
MLKSLKIRILFGILGIVLLTNISNMVLVQKATEKVLSKAQKDNAHNLINTVILNVENEYKSILFHKESSLERRKSELKNLNNIAVTIIEGFYNDSVNGILSEQDARQQAVQVIKQLQYDGGVGYFWINDTMQPFPRMIMHPTIPELDGMILDSPDFDKALGIEKNLFVAFVDICLENGDAYVDYLWPKPTPDGLTEVQPKISYGQLFKEWNWIIGTGVYIDDIEEDVQKRISAVLEELKDTFSRVDIPESGYMFIFSGDKQYLIHPLLEGTDGSLRINPATGKPIMDELIDASGTPEIPYEYIWNKPQHEDEYRFWKMAYISYFAPLDWYIGSSIYTDEIANPARALTRQIILLSLIFIAAAIILSLLLSQSLTKPLQKLTIAAQEIEKGGNLDGQIPISGTMETMELGIILGNMIKSIKKTGDQLRQAQKMETVGTLAGGLAHDFNNMLGGIVGTLSLIEIRLEKDGIVNKETLEEYVGTMRECSFRATSMVQQLLSLSREQEMSLTQVDLNNIIKNVMKICKNSFDKSIQLNPIYTTTPSIIKADATQIEQALLNFCINAEHAMTLMRSKGETWGGTLTVSIDELTTDNFFCKIHHEAHLGTYYVLSVKDTGVGMDMTTVAKIFNPFFTTKKTGEGSGLGLSMVYNIIKQHDGFIDVCSEPEVGSNLKIHLPALSMDQIKEMKKITRKKLPIGKGLILVVDDEKAMRKTAEEILTTNGYRVILAKNGMEGLNIFKDHYADIDAVLLDMAMPEMSGKESFLEMKKIDPEIKVILTSGFRHDERVDDLMAMGIKMFVQKPYTFDSLIEVFHRLFN